MKKCSFLYLLALICFSKAGAQVCTGALGDPTVIVDFGSGGSGGPLPGIDPAYEFVNGNCPIEAQYTMAGSSYFCFNNSWYTVPADHTPGDQNGNFLLVNGGNKGPLYSSVIAGLCEGTTYVVSEYSLNMMRFPACGTSILPNLEFTIETPAGTVLATYQTGKLPETPFLSWVNGKFSFDLPAGLTTVVLKISSLSASGCGNDFAIDDIGFSPCGPAVNVGFNSSSASRIEVCQGDPLGFTLSATAVGGYANPYYQWEVRTEQSPGWELLAGATSLNYITSINGKPGTYEFRLVVANGFVPTLGDKCVVASKIISVTVYEKPFINATTYLYGCYGSDVPLQASGGSNYLWSGPNGFSANVATPILHNVTSKDAGRYFVKGTTIKGCWDTASSELLIYTAPIGTASFYEANICEDQPLQLKAYGGNHYYWLPRNTFTNDTIPEPIAKLKDSTQIICVVSTVPFCDDTVRIQVNVWKNPVADAGPDKRVKLGNPVQLTGKIKGTDVRHYWTPGSYLDQPANLNPVATPPQDMGYQLHVESEHGCRADIDEMKVRVFDKVIIPNTFTPNGDGINDKWDIKDLDVFTDAILEVYNTAGQRVYRSTGYDQPWDGTMNGRPLPVGTYYYAINLKDTKTKPMVGYVTIMR